jgi:hypothetical protein
MNPREKEYERRDARARKGGLKGWSFGGAEVFADKVKVSGDRERWKGTGVGCGKRV